MLFGKGIELAWPHEALTALQQQRSNILRALYQWSSSDPSYLLPFKGAYLLTCVFIALVSVILCK
jgi:hypothetical protein